ncbi:mitochondrial import inner membrane translocase subunit Tim29 [Gouania willdenowi]|uniref:Mitochondrial import inner membrane translocase subunit Tim29 n=1 Tax=Gouania willdenowi TaxID=441366 RepID=A0A8C5N5P0_GOUWI|nr:mitochondrial import inner membrane translocase subunit Tim29 [Gouania willdenowi]
MAWFFSLRRALSSASVSSPKSRWESVKSSKAGVWLRSLLTDYREACKEIVVGAVARPIKASVYASLLGGALICAYTKPDQSSFRAALLERSNQLSLLSPWIRSSTSDGHVQNLVKLHNQGRLHHLSLGLLSVVYQSDYDADVSVYEAQCSNLSPLWRELPHRVLDVGFVGCWWILESKMKDYDMNEEEFKHLPVHMQLTSPPTVQEVQRNEQLHKESCLVVNVQEEEEQAVDSVGGAVQKGL